MFKSFVIFAAISLTVTDPLWAGGKWDISSDGYSFTKTYGDNHCTARLFEKGLLIVLVENNNLPLVQTFFTLVDQKKKSERYVFQSGNKAVLTRHRCGGFPRELKIDDGPRCISHQHCGP